MTLHKRDGAIALIASSGVILGVGLMIQPLDARSITVVLLAWVSFFASREVLNAVLVLERLERKSYKRVIKRLDAAAQADGQSRQTTINNISHLAKLPPYDQTAVEMIETQIVALEARERERAARIFTGKEWTD